MEFTSKLIYTKFKIDIVMSLVYIDNNFPFLKNVFVCDVECGSAVNH